MTKPTKTINITQQKNKSSSTNKHPSVITSKGLPVHVADLTITPSCLTIEILSPSNTNIIQEFNVSAKSDTLDVDLKSIFKLLAQEDVKGVRLHGKKSTCEILADKFLKKGIRPLISNISNKKNLISGSGIPGIPVINTEVAGIDIGQSLMYVAVPPHLDGDHTRVFGTFTSDLQNIVDWLKALGIKTVAMESTSIYWIPLYALLEANGIKSILVNPKNTKSLPGRKTDVLDSQWLMRLLACGMVTGGFIPPEPFRTLRNEVRHRQDLMERAATCLNMIHKYLELMNIKLGMVISDISGKSGLAIIEAIANGQHNPKVLVELADKRCKASKEEMIEALTGMYRKDEVFMMKQELELYVIFHQKIIEIELKIKENLEKLPDRDNLEPLPRSTKRIQIKKSYNCSPYCFDLRSLLYKKFGFDLTTLPGIQENTAAVIIFETGCSMDAFPTSKHFSSWAGVSPGNKVSGGKVLSRKAPKKNSRVGQALRNAAHANTRADNGTGAHYRMLVRKGKCKKAAHKATAHKIALQVYNMMKFGEKYVEQGAEAYDKKHEERKIIAMTKALEKLGYETKKKVA